jgi:repressor LexA
VINLKQFHEILSELRSKKFTQGELAAKLGVSRSAVAMWESGMREPTLEMISNIAKVLEISPTTLLGYGASSDIEFAYNISPALTKSAVDEALSHFKPNTLILNFDEQIHANHYEPRVLPISSLPVSAGGGVFLEGEDFNMVTVPLQVPSSAKYGVPISGVSMEPNYPDGWIVWVEPCSSPRIGEVGLFSYDGNGYVKIWNGDSLTSINPDYEPITLNEDYQLYILGKVVAVTEKPLV